VPGIGSLTTSNYTYYVSVGNKFSFLVKRSLNKDYEALMAHYLWPRTLMETNLAYALATQWLAAAEMDVGRLNHDCKVSIRAWSPTGKDGGQFVPLYWVSWAKDGEPAAMVELFAQTKTLRQLHVEKPEYILRQPLVVSSADALRSQTNAPTRRDSPARK
jgi:hypothetical protein